MHKHHHSDSRECQSHQGVNSLKTNKAYHFITYSVISLISHMFNGMRNNIVHEAASSENVITGYYYDGYFVGHATPCSFEEDRRDV